MTANCSYLPRVLAAGLLACGLWASEYRGTVTSGGLPVPGATVTAVQNERKLLTTTDEQGAFRFADLPDGVWTLEVGMLGFAPLKQQVNLPAAAPAAWDLKLLSQEALLA